MRRARKETRIWKDRRGIAAVEFALATPLLLTLLLGTAEMARFLMIHQKAETISFAVSDLIAQTEATSISISTINSLLTAASEIMKPFTFGANGLVIVSSVTKTGANAPTVRWRQTGGGTLSASSQIGAVNSPASLPVGFTLNASDNLIVTEVYYTYTPMFGSQIVGSSTIRKVSYYKPRLGSLTTPPT